jgi:two-component system sensor histidine kinase/response regulator
VNGYEATRRIRELPHGASLPIVAMTAHALKGDEEKCLEAGMDGYISKPVNQDRLFHTLWRLLRTGGPLSEARGAGNEAPLAVRSLDQDRTGVDHRLPAARISPDNGYAPSPALPGIDMERTLQMLEIDNAAFIRILRGFHAHNQDIVEKLKLAREDSDLELMRQLSHGLKGSAANIGAAELSAAAQAIEEACTGEFAADAGPTHLEGLIDDVAAALNQVLSSIQRVANSGSDRTTALESDEADLSLDALLLRLAEAIDRSDPEQIMELLPAIRQMAHQRGPLDPSSLKLLEKQLARYDYDDALETIQKFTKR